MSTDKIYLCEKQKEIIKEKLCEIKKPSEVL